VGDLPSVALAVVAVATLTGAAIQGGIGFGMNLLVVPVMALVMPEVLPAAAILLGVPISITMLRYEFSALDRAGIAWLFGGRVPGTVIGVALVATVTTAVLQVLVASVVLLFVAASVAAPPIRVTRLTKLGAGAVSGVTGTAAGIGGPPVALLYQHHRGSVMRSTLAASFFFGTLLSFGGLAVGGQVTARQLLVGLVLAPVVVSGSVLGRRLHAVLDRGWLRPAVLTFAAAAALGTIVDVVL
jgi:uncharacterized protein